MTRNLRRLSALATIALLGAGCGGSSASPATDPDAGTTVTSAGATKKATARDEAVRFAACMRDNGVRDFPDPGASGELTADAVANDSPVDTSAPAYDRAIVACKDLQPSGFTGEKRSSGQQSAVLEFAQCMRENGIEDFPDPAPDGPPIDTNRIPSAKGRGALEIPGFKAAQDRCSELLAGVVSPE